MCSTSRMSDLTRGAVRFGCWAKRRAASVSTCRPRGPVSGRPGKAPSEAGRARRRAAGCRSASSRRSGGAGPIPVPRTRNLAAAGSRCWPEWSSAATAATACRSAAGHGGRIAVPRRAAWPGTGAACRWRVTRWTGGSAGFFWRRQGVRAPVAFRRLGCGWGPNQRRCCVGIACTLSVANMTRGRRVEPAPAWTSTGIWRHSASCSVSGRSSCKAASRRGRG